MLNLDPILIVIAGANGSGKTTLTMDVLAHKWLDGCVYINPDNIALDIFGDWNSPDAVLAAAKYAEEARERCLQSRENMAFESILSTPEKVDFIRRAKMKGYFVRLFYVGTNKPSINAARVANRMLEGGHEVPLSKILSRYSNSLLHCPQVTAIVDRAYFFDNSVENEKHKLLFRTVNGEIARIYCDLQAHKWASELLRVISHTRDPAHRDTDNTMKKITEEDSFVP